MLVLDYETFVRDSDQFSDREINERIDIALFGLAGEIGSVAAAIKKRRLYRGKSSLAVANDEIVEELGDALWYCTMLAQLVSAERSQDIFSFDIAKLTSEVGAGDERASRIKSILDPVKRVQFLDAAHDFPSANTGLEFETYQDLAYLTARTEGDVLIEVCLSVLWQLNAELLRRQLPPIERELNNALPDRPVNDVLAEVLWHLSALASIFDLRLSNIAQANILKVGARRNREKRARLHDKGFPKKERFPRKFDVAFVTLKNGQARMYVDGRRLGDALTDNAYEDDGYRYHDVMHLANVAVLGWSPVFRALLKRKRKSDPRVDEVEDGARAQIVEEAVIKAIHAEGLKLAREQGNAESEQARLFPQRMDISFRLLQLARSFVFDLEAWDNFYWEWEDAIYIGHEIFHRVRQEGQGTVTVDLKNQTLGFTPNVCIEMNGPLAALGSAFVAFSTPVDELEARLTEVERQRAKFPDDYSIRVQAVRKAAILEALKLKGDAAELYQALHVTPLDDDRISVRGQNVVERAIRTHNIVRFRTTLAQSDNGLHCIVTALADQSDQ